MAFDPSAADNSKKLRLTLDSSLVSSDQADFPLTIHLDSTDSLQGRFFTELTAGSKKFAITKNGEQLPVEIECFDSAKATLHTKVPTYSASSDSELILSFDNTQEDNINVGFTGDVNQIYDGGEPNVFPATWYGTKRCLIPGDLLEVINGKARIKFYYYLDTNYTIASLYVWKQASSGAELYDCEEGTGVQITKEGSSTISVTGPDQYSDWFDFTLAEGESVIITYYQGYINPYGNVDGTETWYKASVNEPDIAVSSGGYTSQGTVHQIIASIESSSASAAWDENYVAVYHMAQDPSGTAPQILDSTSNGYHGTVNGSMTSGDLVDGLVGKALAFDGVDDQIVLPTLPQLTNFTVTWVAEFNSTSPGNVIAKYAGGYADDFLSGVDPEDANTPDDIISAVFQRSSDSSRVILSDTTNTAVSTPYVASIASNGTTVDLYINGILVDTIHSSVFIESGAWAIGAANNLGFVSGTVSFCCIDTVYRNADWVALTNASLRDQLITWSAYSAAGSLRKVYRQSFGICSELRQLLRHVFALPERVSYKHSFAVAAPLRLPVEQVFALKERQVYKQVFSDASTVRQAIRQVFGDMRTQRKSYHHNFQDMLSVRATYEQVFALPELVRAVYHQDFAVAAERLRQVTHQNWSVKDVDLLRQTVHQVFVLAGVTGEYRQYSVGVRVDGEVVPNPVKINLERDIDIYYIEALITPAIQPHFKRYRHKSTVLLDLNGTEYTLMVTTPQRSRTHGGGSYTVECQSPAVLLGEAYADTVSGTFTGFASQIAASLAPDFTVDWQVQDEYYSAGQLIVADQYPIEVIRDLAAAVGGVVQSNPDGSLKVVRRRKVRVDRLAETAPDYTLSDVDDFSTVSEEPLRRKRYNKYVVSNQSTAAEGLRVETEDISKTLKEARLYQTPWAGDADLSHTGGDWVVIQSLGIEERQETETVEFVDGAGATSYPIYAHQPPVWHQINLGTITFSEDGSLEAQVSGDSLLELTYTTRCKLYQVRDPNEEQVQLVGADVLQVGKTTVVVQYGDSVASDQQFAVLELDGTLNLDDDGNEQTSFAPGDEPYFLLHLGPGLYVDRIAATDGMVVDHGAVTLSREQEALFASEDNGALSYYPAGAVTLAWQGRIGTGFNVDGLDIAITGNWPAVAKISYPVNFTRYRLVPPVLDLAEDESYQVYTVVYVEAA